MKGEQTKRRATQGNCTLCGKSFSKTTMGKHLVTCKRSDASGAPGKRGTQTFLLKVEGRGVPEYWMFLEVPTKATLLDLDKFLRATWLECCGHCSAFRIGEQSYSPFAGDDEPTGPWERDDQSMDVALGQVLSPGLRFSYEYDFGSTTELALQVVAEAEGHIDRKPVRVMARNDPPVFECMACGKPATQVCTQCVWDGPGHLCDQCAGEHECGEEMLLPLVNSPRTGICGYAG